MSSEQLTSLLGELDLAVGPRAAFATELRARLLDELERPARRHGRTLLLAAVLLLLLAGIATATYLVVHDPVATKSPGTLTLISPRSNAADQIVAVLPGGRTRVVWHCPQNVFCGDLMSIDWSPDGRRLAFALTELGGRSAYPGLHILDTRTGRDLHIPSLSLAHPLSPHQSAAVMERAGKQLMARLRCTTPSDLAWSPNGKRLAYACRHDPDNPPWPTGPRARIYTIGSDGRHRRLLPTGAVDAFSPSWSPDGKRIAFATWAKPVETIRYDTEKPPIVRHSSLYVIGLDGSGRRLLVHDAATPDWSPDGHSIAYDSLDGVKLISPSGHDLTPALPGIAPRAIAPKGVPAWSPDGSRLSVQTTAGVLLVDTSSWRSTVATGLTGSGLFGRARPAWYPGRGLPVVRGMNSARVGCSPCL